MSDIKQTETEQTAIVADQSEELSVEELENAAGGEMMSEDEFASNNAGCANWKCTAGL